MKWLIKFVSVCQMAGYMANPLFGNDTSRFVGSSQPIEFATGIQIIEQLESQWHRASWKAESQYGVLRDVANLNSLERDPTFCKATVITEPKTGKTRADVTAVMKWVHGKDPYLAVVGKYGFGGDLDRWWETQKPGLQLPTVETRGHGEVSQVDLSNLERVFPNTGVSMFPPCFLGKPLSVGLRRVVERGKQVGIEKHADSSWTIRTFDFTCNDDEWETDSRLQIEYDSMHGGIITGAVWSQVVPAKSAIPISWRQLFVSQTDLADGFRAPSQVDLVNLLQKTDSRITFTDILRNPPADDSTFRITFPRGIYVTDKVHNKAYVVGAGMENDQRAVREFIERYQLAEQQIERSRFLWILAGAAALLTLVIALVWTRHLWWSRVA